MAPNRKILIFRCAYAGRHHDKGILNQEGWAEWIPDDVWIQGDLGFFGLQNEGAMSRCPTTNRQGDNSVTLHPVVDGNA